MRYNVAGDRDGCSGPVGDAHARRPGRSARGGRGGHPPYRRSFTRSIPPRPSPFSSHHFCELRNNVRARIRASCVRACARVRASDLRRKKNYARVTHVARNVSLLRVGLNRFDDEPLSVIRLVGMRLEKSTPRGLLDRMDFKSLVHARAEEFHSRRARSWDVRSVVSMSNRNIRASMSSHVPAGRVDYQGRRASRTLQFREPRIRSRSTLLRGRKNRFQTVHVATCFFARLSLSPRFSRASSLVEPSATSQRYARGKALFSRVARCLSFPTITEVFAPVLRLNHKIHRL